VKIKTDAKIAAAQKATAAQVVAAATTRNQEEPRIAKMARHFDGKPNLDPDEVENFPLPITPVRAILPKKIEDKPPSPYTLAYEWRKGKGDVIGDAFMSKGTNVLMIHQYGMECSVLLKVDKKHRKQIDERTTQIWVSFRVMQGPLNEIIEGFKEAGWSLNPRIDKLLNPLPIAALRQKFDNLDEVLDAMATNGWSIKPPPSGQQLNLLDGRK